MGLENKFGPMAHILKDNGKIIYRMEKEYLLKKMGTNLMVSGYKEERMDTLRIFKIINKMELSKIHTVGNGLMVKNKVKELKYGMMELNSKVIMIMIKNMEMGHCI